MADSDSNILPVPSAQANLSYSGGQKRQYGLVGLPILGLSSTAGAGCVATGVADFSRAGVGIDTAGWIGAFASVLTLVVFSSAGVAEPGGATKAWPDSSRYRDTSARLSRTYLNPSSTVLSALGF